jgi:glycosyltransferase involved in cell wall biosynthesis
VYEGFGLPACEVASCGTPLLSTTGGALGEILEPDVTARLVPPGDATALAAGMRRMLHDVELRGRLSSTSRASIESRFTWTRAAEQLERIYADLVRD